MSSRPELRPYLLGSERGLEAEVVKEEEERVTFSLRRCKASGPVNEFALGREAKVSRNCNCTPH